MEIEPALRLALDYASKAGASFTEARGEKTTKFKISLENDKVNQASYDIKIGIGIRIFLNGSAGFSFTNKLNKQSIKETVNIALKIAKVSKKVKSKINIKKPKLNKFSPKKLNVQVHPKKISEKEKQELCLDLYRNSSSFKEIVKIQSRYAEYYGKIYYVNSCGVNISYEPLLIGLSVNCTARKNGALNESYNEVGGSFGFELFKKESCSPEYLSRDASIWAIRKLHARSPPTGEFPVVIDPILGGTIIHESFGHLAEADRIIAGQSPLVNRIGQIISSEKLTIIDEGTPACGGFYIPFDDEGTPCRRLEIVRNGVLMGYMSNREASSELGIELTGNARSQDYSYEPIVRMRNTYIKSGDWKFEELIEETKEGIYAIDIIGGYVTDGLFTFKSPRGYLIKNGELKHPLRDIVISGEIMSFLKNVDAVCNDLRLDANPFFSCLKSGQRVFVGTGAPHFRVKTIHIGI